MLDEYYRERGETRLQRLDRKYGSCTGMVVGMTLIVGVVVGVIVLVQALITPVSYEVPDQLARIVDSCQTQNGSLTYNFISCLIDAGVGFTINGEPVLIEESDHAD